MKLRFPRLFSYVLNENLSAVEVYSNELMNLFYRPISAQAYQELQELQVIMSANPLSDQKDVWSYAWGEKYTSAQFYKHIHKHIRVPNVYKWLWKSSCRLSTKVFA
jgi:hypothetical protein